MKRVLDDNLVSIKWSCPDCKTNCEIPPSFYQDNGTPLCHECGYDMNYIHTILEIPKKKKITCHNCEGNGLCLCFLYK